METQVLKVGIVLGLLALPICAWASPRLAHRLGARQHVRPEGPSTHGKKAGTPTMGGLVPLLALLTGAGVLWGWRGVDWPSGFAAISMVLASAIGLWDDLRSQRGRRSTGFFPHQTMLAQFLAAGLLIILALRFPQTMCLPFAKLAWVPPAWVWIPLLALAFLGTVNGVNLADGLDGLATGLFIFAVLGLIPLLLSVPKLGAMAFLALGAGLGFLWANAHPAKVFLGNVGAMGLGGLLFGLAWGAGGVLLLPLVGGVFVVEALSDILQVGSYKLTGVRLFKMSPLHHHLEDAPVPWPHRVRSPHWPEPKVVARLWVVGAGCALIGVLAIL